MIAFKLPFRTLFEVEIEEKYTGQIRLAKRRNKKRKQVLKKQEIELQVRFPQVARGIEKRKSVAERERERMDGKN